MTEGMTRSNASGTTGRRRPAVANSRPIALFIVLSCLAGCVPDAPEAVSELYRQGNAFYERGQYAEASRTYERIIEQGFYNGYIYYNLGNAYFKQEKLGKAILAYERALRLMPREPDVQANLEIANLRITDKIQTPAPWIGEALVRRIYGAVTVNEATLGVSGLFGLLIALVIVRMCSSHPDRRRRLMTWCVALSGMLLLAGAFAGFKIRDHLVRDEAIILVDAFEVRSGPGTQYNEVFELHEGTKVRIIEQRGTWMRIALSDGKNGWIQEEALEVI